ncbi:MAG: hypothetical protein M1834_005412 [Cirrosporium novae-zelandiae]|nr:MAG: hypothetical protein M1834_005412 [Cirrosporium novae-zelandiae]
MANEEIQSQTRSNLSEKNQSAVEVLPHDVSEEGFDGNYKDFPLGEAIIPTDSEEVVDPRLKNYPIPLVAKCVGLKNDPTYAIQLLSWGMGNAMAKYLPTRTFNIFGWRWSLNPGPWNAKEHALIVVAYWGSCYTAYGLGPLSAMELYYGIKINAGWGIIFLITTQMIGYGFAGLYRDILVRPPKIYYPSVLPNVSLFNAMHHDPAATKKALKFFSMVACAAFVYEWFPSLIFPLLSSLPLVCYFGHGNWQAWVLGSGTYGFGLLDFSLDWNYISYFSPMYTPLWSTANQAAGALAASWVLYPIMYFSNTMNAKKFAPMSSGTWDASGAEYNISRILTSTHTLNQTAMDEYSTPHWSPSYAMYFFWGFSGSTGAMVYAALWYGKSSWTALKDAYHNRREDYDDPYLKVMAGSPRVPHWWYITLLVVCAALGIAQLYEGEMDLPWWGLIVIAVISFVFTWPNGILWGVANIQIGMAFLSELIAGALFPGKPIAVLACMSYGRQILEQNLNLISDYKFGFYMKIPEREMFWGQVWGTLLGPFINYGMMRFIIDHEAAQLTGEVASNSWNALKTKNFYSLSVIWGVLGPKVFFAKDSPYAWVYWGFLAGAGTVFALWLVHKWKPNWNIEERFNPVVMFYGATIVPVYTTTNLMTSALVGFFFMGYMYRYHPAWFRKYNYLLGVGLDCGTQLMTTCPMLLSQRGGEMRPLQIVAFLRPIFHLMP